MKVEGAAVYTVDLYALRDSADPCRDGGYRELAGRNNRRGNDGNSKLSLGSGLTRCWMRGRAGVWSRDERPLLDGVYCHQVLNSVKRGLA